MAAKQGSKLSLKPSVRFPVPASDGRTESWKVSVATGNGVFECVGDDGRRAEFHESEIRLRIDASPERQDGPNHIGAKMTLIWWDAQKPGEPLHAKMANDVPGLERQVFLRGSVILIGDRRTFLATEVVAPPDPFKEAMADASFMRSLRAALRIPQMPDLRALYEAELIGAAYDPRTRDPIPEALLKKEAPSERADRLARAAKMKAAHKAGARTRKARAKAKAGGFPRQ